MKFLIASDLHGSAYYAKKLVETFKSEKADKLILLGDIYNHGPRNVLPKEYSPMVVAEVLNSVKDKLLVIKGNCDSEVDKMISEFSFIEDAVVVSGDKQKTLSSTATTESLIASVDAYYNANFTSTNTSYKIAKDAATFEKLVDSKDITVAVFGRDTCYYCNIYNFLFPNVFSRRR